MPKRAAFAAVAWAAATASAMAVVWAGLNSVLPGATEGPHVATMAAWPAQVAGGGTAVALPSASASASASGASAAPDPHRASSTPRPAASTPAEPGRPSASAPTTQSPATPEGVERAYPTPGGTAVLLIGATSASFVAATPAPGYSMRPFSSPGIIEVVFSPPDTGTVYEVIATWNGTSPQVQTYAIGG